MSTANLTAVLTTVLRQSPALTALVPAERITHGWIKDLETLPALTLTLIDSQALDSTHEPDRLRTSNVQLTAWVHRLGEGHAILDAAEDVLLPGGQGGGMQWVGCDDDRVERPDERVSYVSIRVELQHGPA